MRARCLGRSGLRVSELCLGAMTFGMPRWGCGESEAVHLIERYFDAGGNFVDTADIYGRGASEEIVGKAVRGRRGQTVVATKCTFPTGRSANARGASRKHIREACEASLRRLRTDYIDLYQTHVDDKATPLEETLAALDDLVRAGKVLYVGCSNYPAYRLALALGISERRGFVRFVSLQPHYNLIVRAAEREHFPLCRDEGVGIITWSPLAAGMLTGKITPAARPADVRLGLRDMPQNAQYLTDRAFAIVEVLRTCAAEVGCTPAQLALAWQLTRPEITSVIIGVRTPAQLEDNLGAADIRVPADVLARLEEASALHAEYPQDFVADAQRLLNP